MQDICFVEAIHINAGKAVIDEGCRACGRCVSVCPNGAIELQVEDGDFLDQTLERLCAAVDLS